MKRSLTIGACSLVLAFALFAGVLPNLISYPAVDSGWSFVGNVGPVSMACTNGCTLDLADNSGAYNVGYSWIKNHFGQPFLEEPQGDEELQVQSNLQNSSISKVVNLPSTQNYKIAVSVLGKLQAPPNGGTAVYPVLQIFHGATLLNICKYPNNTSITSTQSLTVNGAAGPDGTLHLLAETCAVSLPAGNNTLGVQIVGGQGKGGLLQVHQFIVYPASGGVNARVGCTSGRSWVDAGTVSGTDLFALNTAAQTAAVAHNCGGTVLFYYSDLKGNLPGASGCAAGAQTCAILDLH